MKILRLELRAFGPFTDRVLDFTAAGGGLQVIYGPNEAGKSSTLRALKAWLYGFHERTRDNFLHSNDQLLVAGEVESAQGERLYFARRKKRKADLLDRDGNPFDPGRLAALLQGVDLETFEHLFGLDHEALVRGGSAILREQGRAATALFAAGSGAGSLREVLAELHARAEEIYKPKGSRPLLNGVLREHAELRREMTRLSLSGNQWRQHDQALRAAHKELENLRGQRAELDRELRYLERLRQVLRPLALRRELLGRLEELAGARLLAQDFSARRSAARDQARAATQSLVQTGRRLEELREKHAAIECNQELLVQAATISHLYQRLGEYRKAMLDRPRLDGMRVEAKTAAANLLRRHRPQVSLDELERLRGLPRRRQALARLGRQQPLLEQAAQDSAARLRKLEEDLQRLRQALESSTNPLDMSALYSAVLPARRLGEIDQQISERTQSLLRLRERFAQDLQRLGSWSGTPAELLSLPLPLTESVEGFARRHQALEEEQRLLRQRHDELQARRRDLAQQLLALEKAGEVLTEEALEAARAERDKGWQLLCRQWLEGEEVVAASRDYHSELPLHLAYEQRLAQADAIADRLRREAERVHQAAHLLAQRQRVEDELGELGARRAQRDAQMQTQAESWRECWQATGIRPLAPGEMLAWLSRMDALRLQAARIGEEQRSLQTLEEGRQRAAMALRHELARLGAAAAPGEELAPLLESAGEILERARATENRQRSQSERLTELQLELPLAREELRRCQQKLQQWQAQWQRMLGELELPTSSLPEEVDADLEALESCLAQWDKAEEFRKRMEGIDRDARELREQVCELARRVAPALEHLPLDQAIEQFHHQLTQARAAHTSLQGLSEAMARCEEEIRQSRQSLEAATEQLRELCALAGCDDPEGLEEAERRWQQRRELEAALMEQERQLSEIAGSQSLTDLEQAAARVDADALPAQLEQLRQQLEQLDARLGELSETIGEERTVLQGMDGRAEAALMAQQAEEKLAEMARLARRYARLRVAARVLETEIERYRAAHQDPVLRLASGYFTELTRGAFQGLRADLDDQGEPVVVGLRGADARVVVEGMSAGSRDQLFLALRLASLEHRLEHAAPMPLIVDDILINFDEWRAVATLGALARLAVKNQVILFTHHQQIAAAASHLGAAVLALDS